MLSFFACASRPGLARRLVTEADGSRIKSGMTERKSLNPHFAKTRPGWAEERRSGRTRARAFLSAASLHVTPTGLNTARRPKRSEGTQTAGRVFFGYFLLAKQKKMTSRRATPGLPTRAKNGISANTPRRVNPC